MNSSGAYVASEATVSVPVDLIAAGTSLTTEGTPAVAAGVVDELVAGFVVEDELLLLPHAAIAPTHTSETGTADHLLIERITTAPFPEDGGSISQKSCAVPGRNAL
jgi:hypothetical protein